MIKNFNYLSVLVCLMVFISCKKNEKRIILSRNNEKVIEIYLDKNEKNNIYLDSLIDIKKVIPLETNKKSFLSSIDKILNYKNNFYVLDKTKNKLCIFDSNGKFIGVVGNRGHGPGEYIDIVDYCIDVKGKQILVLSAEKKSLYYYNIYGEHIKTKKIPFQAFSISINKNQELAFYLSYFDKDFVNLKVTDINAEKILYSGFSYPKDNRPMNLTNITGGLVNNKEGFLYSDATSSYIHKITDDSDISTKYHIDFGSSFVEEEDKYQFYKFFEGIQKGSFSFLTNLYQENDNALIFTYNRESSNVKNVIVQRYNAYFDKKNRIVYSTENIKESFLSKKLSSPLGVTGDNRFISIVNPIDYLNYKEDNQNTHIISTELKAILKNIKEGDNPMLILYDI